MSHVQHYPDGQIITTDKEHTGQAAGAEHNHTASGPGVRDTARGSSSGGADVSVTPLRTVAAGVLAGAFPQQFMNSINAGNEQLGNRAFLHWVKGMHGSGREPDAGEAAPLQLMLKKNKGESTAQEMPEATPAAPPGPGAQAKAKIPLVAAEPGEAAVPGEKKKKKKSKAQAALNILRAEGVESFRRYVDEEVSVTASLRGIQERIIRAEDLGGMKEAALGVVAARLRVLDPEAGLTTPVATRSGSGQDKQEPARAQLKTDLTAKERMLFDCCIKGETGHVRRLLRFGAVDVNMGSRYGTLLTIAAYAGHVILVRELLSMPGIDVNLAQRNGATPLFFAAQQGHAEVAKLLLAVRGINVNLAETHGATPLYIAAHKGQEEIVGLLLAVPNIKIDARRDNGATALFSAVQDNYPGIVEQLMKRGANVNIPLNKGTTPLCIAARKGSIEITRLLLRAPAIQVNLATEDGVTALGLAAKLGHKEILRSLLRKEANPEIAHITGISPLHLACLHGHKAVVEILLNAGANMEREVVSGTGKHTPDSLAQLGGHKEIMTLLQAHRRNRAVRTARLEKLSGEDQPARTSPATTAPEAASPPATRTHTQSGETLSTPSVTQAGQAAGIVEPAGTEPSTTSPEPLSEALPDSPTQATKTGSPLEMAKKELIQGILGKLQQDNLESLEGIRLMVEVRAAESIDSLCTLYNRLAGIERQKERARRRGGRRRVVPLGMEEAPATGDSAPTFALGKKRGLDAEAVEVEMKRHLAQSCHRFISQAVNDMEFGRGKPTSGYPGLLHASAGIADVGSCSVFFYTDEETPVIRIVGVGHHVGRATYELAYAAEVLGRCGRILRIA